MATKILSLLFMTLVAAGFIGISVKGIAQSSVYKCAGNDGSVVYSDVPCSDNPDKHVIHESYRPDPANPVRVSPPPTPSRIEAAPRSATARESKAEVETPPVRSQPMATKCSSQDGRKIYYTLSNCGRTSVTAHGHVIGTGELVHGRARLSDTAEPAPYSEACAWARREADNTRNSSTDRRSARALMKTVCN